MSAAVVTALGFVSQAHAQASAQDRAAADALFDSGVKLMNEGRFKEACPKLEKSFGLDPGVGTLLNLGSCYEQAGQLASAWTTYREASALARTEGQTVREEHARAEAKKLEPRLVRIQIDVAPGLTNLPGFRLSQDGNDLVVDAVVGEPIPVDAGKHQVVAGADGYEPRTFEVEPTEEGKTYTVLIEGLEKSAASSSTAAPPPVTPTESSASPEPAPEKKRSLVGPIILGATGLAAAGVGTAFAFIAKGHDNNARAICDDPQEACTDDDVDDWEDDLDSARGAATIAYIGWGVGGAALVGAALWLVLDNPGSNSETVRQVKFAPLVGKNSWGVGARGTF